jgi:hypothetical protein
LRQSCTGQTDKWHITDEALNMTDEALS